MISISESFYNNVTAYRDEPTSHGKMIAKRVTTVLPLSLIIAVGLIETLVSGIFVILSGFGSSMIKSNFRSSLGATGNALADVMWRNWTTSLPPAPYISPYEALYGSRPIRRAAPESRSYDPRPFVSSLPARAPRSFDPRPSPAPMAPPPLVPFVPKARIQRWIDHAQAPAESRPFTQEQALVWVKEFPFNPHPFYHATDTQALNQGIKVLGEIRAQHFNAALNREFNSANMNVAPKIIFVTLLHCFNSGFRVDTLPPVFLKPETMNAVYQLQSKYVGTLVFNGRNYADVAETKFDTLTNDREKDVFQTLWAIASREVKGSFLPRCWPAIIFPDFP